LIRALCRGLARFKVTGDKYDVHILLDDGFPAATAATAVTEREGSRSASGVTTTAVVASDSLCAAFLGLSAAACARVEAKQDKTELMLRFASLQGIFEVHPTASWEATHGSSPTGQVPSGGKSKKKEKERPAMLAARLLGPAEVLQLLQSQVEAVSDVWRIM